MSKKSGFDKPDVMRITLFIFIALIVIFVYLVFNSYSNNPTRVFNRMLENTLSTATYTKTITSQQGSEGITEVVNVSTGAINRVVEKQSLIVSGSKLGGVKILNFGTPSTDYSKYTLIDTDAKNKSGKIINFSPIVNVWGGSSPGGPSYNGGQLFSQSVLDIVPIANINPQLKKQFLNYLHTKNVYSYSGKVNAQSINGRSVFVYHVNINVFYLHYYQYLFSHGIGLTTGKISSIGKVPSKQSTQQAIFYIDKTSGQLSQVTFKNSNQKYVYSSYGATPPTIPTPTKYLPMATLENQINSLINN